MSFNTLYLESKKSRKSSFDSYMASKGANKGEIKEKKKLAESLAKKAGMEDNYAYKMGIVKKMMGESVIKDALNWEIKKQVTEILSEELVQYDEIDLGGIAEKVTSTVTRTIVNNEHLLNKIIDGVMNKLHGKTLSFKIGKD